MRASALVPTHVLATMADRGLSARARQVALTLLVDPLMPPTGVLRYSVPSLAYSTGLSAPAVERALDELADAGILGLDSAVGELWLPAALYTESHQLHNWRSHMLSQLAAVSSVDLREQASAYIQQFRR
jgi:hypothetical protein